MLTVLAGAVSAASVPPAVERLKPGQWLELTGNADGTIAGTKLSRVFPRRSGHPAWGTIGPRAVVEAWSGGAYDSRSRQLVVVGGGHADYGGNEVYAFDLDSLEWKRLTEPSALRRQGGQFLTVDGTPVSRHTYDGVQYLPKLDRLFMFGGSMWRHGNPTDRLPWLFDPTAKQWRSGAAAPHSGFPATALHPETGLVYVRTRNRLMSYDPAVDRWQVLINDGWFRGGTAVIEPASNRMFAVNRDGTWFVDLDKPRFLVSNRICQSPTPGCWSLVPNSGDEAMRRARPGLALDPKTGRILAWAGGPDVHSLDPRRLVWTREPRTAGPAPNTRVTPTSRSRGIYGRWRYVPHWDVFIGVNDPSGNVWVYRPIR